MYPTIFIEYITFPLGGLIWEIKKKKKKKKHHISNTKRKSDETKRKVNMVPELTPPARPAKVPPPH